MTDTSLPQVRSFPWLRGYQGHFKKPGGSWQFVRNPDGSAKVFPTSEAAKDAATQIVFRFMCPEIVAERPSEPASESQGIEAAWAAEAIAMRASKAEEARQLRQSVERSFQHKAGKRPVEVITKKAKRA